MKCLYLITICASLALLAGCATAPQPEATTIQGTWKGQEVRDGRAFSSWLTLSDGEADYRGTDPNDSLRGTYTLNERANPKELILVVTQSALNQYVGKTANTIYELIPGKDGHDTLIITGNEPGDPQFPSGFADRRARQIVFTRD